MFRYLMFGLWRKISRHLLSLIPTSRDSDNRASSGVKKVGWLVVKFSNGLIELLYHYFDRFLNGHSWYLVEKYGKSTVEEILTTVIHSFFD